MDIINYWLFKLYATETGVYTKGGVMVIYTGTVPLYFPRLSSISTSTFLPYVICGSPILLVVLYLFLVPFLYFHRVCSIQDTKFELSYLLLTGIQVALSVVASKLSPYGITSGQLVEGISATHGARILGGHGTGQRYKRQ